MKLQRYLLACIVLVIAITVLAMPVSAALKSVTPGGIVLLGEEGLDVTNAVGLATHLGWWSGSDYSTTPARVIDLSIYDPNNFNIDDGVGSPFVGTEGKGPWWRLNSSGETNPTQQAFSVETARVTLKVRNLKFSGQPPLSSPGVDVTNGVAILGDVLDFELTQSTLPYIFQRPDGGTFNCKIVVKSPGGVTYSQLWTPVPAQKSVINQPVNISPWYWSSGNGLATNSTTGWDTGSVSSGIPIYSTGVYQVWIECNHNNLGFVGTTRTVTLEEEQPVLTATPASLIRGGKIYTTIKGIPGAEYLIWMKDCVACPNNCCSKAMSGNCCDKPPTILDGQEGVTFEPLRCHNMSCPCEHPPCDYGDDDQDMDESCFGCTLIDWCGCMCTEHLRDTMPPETATERYFALVTLDENGERTIEWQTSTCTAPGTYKVHTQRWEPKDLCELDPTRPFAETCVTVQKGTVTINTEVCGQITSATYLGEVVRVFGTNSDSKVTHLFITGPCQDCVGENMTVTNAVVKGDGSTFTRVKVKPDGTWEYFWYTRELSIDLGEYTIYASSMPDDKPALEGVACTECIGPGYSCAAWAKKLFTFLKPDITAGIHPPIVQIDCCEPPAITVAGHASGLRGTSVNKTYNTVPLGIWVFGADKVAGKNYVFETFNVNCNTGEFSVNLANYMNTLALEPGTYTVVVQHPMYNQRLDIIPETKIFEQSGWYYWWMMCTTYSYLEEEIWYPDANRKFVVTATPVRWSKLFIIEGTTRLAGTQALNALLIGFENPNIDDEIKVVQFKVESNTALKADFAGMPTSGAAPLPVQFTDISTGAPTSWYWNFGDGVFSTEQNPSHTYLNPGTYTVGLTVANAYGTSSITKNSYITVTGVGPTPTPTPTPVPGSDMISLKSGWNFVSTPKTLADGMKTAGVVFAGVDTAGRSIYLYNAENGLWESMTASSVVKPLDGIWVYSAGAKDIPLTFKSGGAATPPTKAVYAGWNAIGFTDLISKSAKSTLISVDDSPRKTWSMVIGWNAVSQTYESAITNTNPENTAHMQPTKGYWLFMNGDQSYYPWVLASLSS